MGELEPGQSQPESDYETLARAAGRLMSAAINGQPGSSEELTAFWAENPYVQAELIKEELRFEGQD
jgi:hypothetical protein